MSFKKGQTVWYYYAPCKPALVTIEEVHEDAITYYQIKESWKKTLTVATKYNLYKYPSDRVRLIEALREDSFYLDKYAKELEDEKIKLDSDFDDVLEEAKNNKGDN